MDTYFEIFGTLIPMRDITFFRLVQREYIYRPLFREVDQTFLGLSKKKYEFAEMIPYAAILGDAEYTLATKKVKTTKVKDNIMKDVAVGIISQAASTFNIKELKYKKYKCINTAGRTFECFLKDVPAVMIRHDGKMSDVYKNDALFQALGESIAPVICIVPALQIKTKTNKNYLFYGNGIQLVDAVSEYERLKSELSIYRANADEQHRLHMEHKKAKSLPNQVSSLAKKLLPHKK